MAYISSPSGTVTDKGAPPVVLDVSNIVETWQTTQPGYDVFLPGGSVEVKIFTEAQAVAAGFDPTTDTPLWSTTKAYALSYIDGVATSTCPTITCDTTQLENDVSYRAYARASIEGTAQTDPWGAWAHSAFALDLDTVAAPSIAVVAEDSVGRIEISAGGSGDKTGHTLPTLSVERSADEGATWIPVRGLTEVVLPSLTAMAVAYDYEAPRGVELTYRARTTTTYAGSRVSSPWATDTVTAALSGWNLKAPQEPTLNAIGLHVTGDVSEEYVEQVSVQRPMNRPRPVVLTAAIAGADLPADGSFTFITTGDAEWLAVRPALRYQGPLFFESVRMGQVGQASHTVSPSERRYSSAAPARLGHVRRVRPGAGGLRCTRYRLSSLRRSCQATRASSCALKHGSAIRCCVSSRSLPAP